ncbi:MAG: hypothetical protein O8C56_12130 [Candidatus Methanoperedens sp.]|nr:hypothetical protein [Candidatus Methanoperedens sp.]
MQTEMLAVKIELQNGEIQDFGALKQLLGLKANSEVVHFALKHCYDELLKPKAPAQEAQA